MSSSTHNRPLLVTGDDNGLVKIWDLSQSQPVLMASFGTQTRSRAVAALCWYDRECTRVMASFADGTTQCLPTTQQAARQHPVVHVDREGLYAATSSSMAMIGDRLVLATKNNGVYVLDPEEGTKSKNVRMHLTVPKKADGVTASSSALDAVHIHRRFGLVAGGGKNNELCVWDVSTKAERGETKLGNPIFVAENVDDHILGVEYPTYITGCCVLDYHTFVAVTAYHQVRFYDRRLNRKPVQEFSIDREIEGRRPTSVLQWNSNKYLIGEAGGDLHLYDTRRGFTSRAKLRGADGSVRCISKHPDGLPIVATTGLDRVARIFHVPTGKQLQQMYLKQMGTCCLLSRGCPAQSIGSLSGTGGAADWQSSTNRKANASAFAGWDEMMPVNDDMNEEEFYAKNNKNDNDDDAAVASAVQASETTDKKAAKSNNEVVASGVEKVNNNNTTVAKNTVNAVFDQKSEDSKKARKEAIALAKQKREELAAAAAKKKEEDDKKREAAEAAAKKERRQLREQQKQAEYEQQRRAQRNYNNNCFGRTFRASSSGSKKKDDSSSSAATATNTTSATKKMQPVRRTRSQ